MAFRFSWAVAACPVVCLVAWVAARKRRCVATTVPACAVPPRRGLGWEFVALCSYVSCRRACAVVVAALSLLLRAGTAYTFAMAVRHLRMVAAAVHVVLWR